MPCDKKSFKKRRFSDVRISVLHKGGNDMEIVMKNNP